MRSISLLVVSLITLVALTACGGRDPGPSGGSDSGAGPETDAALGADVPPAFRRDHYDQCVADAECPEGDLCQFYWPSETLPVPEVPPRKMCRPACTSALECPGESTAGGEASCGADGRCYLYCGLGFIAECISPYRCSHFREESNDGYCVGF